MLNIAKSALMLATKFYSAEQLAHAMRVAQYAQKRYEAPTELWDEVIFTIGLLHDIYEDTECTVDDVYDALPDDMRTTIMSTLVLLTHIKEQCSYDEYMQKIMDSDSEFAVIVKAADMKDHWMQYDTLTPKLKEKYGKWIGQLL